MEPKLIFPPDDKKLDYISSKKFRQMLGSLQYLTTTRPNVSFAVNRMLQFVVNPTKMHWMVLQRILGICRQTHIQYYEFKP